MPATPRLQSLDILRGIAIALMILYHFSYDLTYFGFAHFDFHHDPFWLHARTGILSSFLLVSGISLTLAASNGVHLKPYLIRAACIAGGAALISLTSWLMFGPRWIFFGVLHFFAVAAILALPFLRRPRLALVLGIGLIVLDRLYSHPFFDQHALQWIGLMTAKPPTEDYVPLIPWFGVVLIGSTLARYRWLREPAPVFTRWHSARALPRLLAWAGRHSLLIYLIHQPVLIAALWTMKQLSSGL